MFRYLIVTLVFLLSAPALSFGADARAEFTQRDFARMILQQFSWNDGLPKEPADRDYLMILGGKRSFRYEAEVAYNEKTDRVTIRNFPLFGSFTGKGWVFGVSDATSANFTIMVPIGGEFEFKAVMKGDGFVWNINDKEYRAGSKSGQFTELDIARIPLKAGVVTLRLAIPPEGAIDSFSLTAADYTPIQPFAGWRFKDGLTAARMAEIVVAMTGRYGELPAAPADDSLKPVSVAGLSALPSTVSLTDAAYLGPFSSARWVRAGIGGALIQIPVKLAEPGYYGITMNVLGEQFSGKVNDVPFRQSAKLYLSRVDMGLFRMESGDNTITVSVPSVGGIDTVEFAKKNTAPGEFLRIAGIKGPPERLISSEEASEQLKKIQGLFPVRR